MRGSPGGVSGNSSPSRFRGVGESKPPRFWFFLRQKEHAPNDMNCIKNLLNRSKILNGSLTQKKELKTAVQKRNEQKKKQREGWSRHAVLCGMAFSGFTFPKGSW